MSGLVLPMLHVAEAWVHGVSQTALVRLSKVVLLGVDWMYQSL